MSDEVENIPKKKEKRKERKKNLKNIEFIYMQKTKSVNVIKEIYRR